MTQEAFVQYLVTGIAVGCIYALVAVGFNIIYNTNGAINFAQGEFVMLGGMFAIACLPWLPLPLAILLAVLLTMLVGAGVEWLFIRWIPRPTVLRMIIVTIGVSILLREAALLLWGKYPLRLPDFTPAPPLRLLGAAVTWQKLWLMGLLAVMAAGLYLFFHYSLLGRAMRACAANRSSATLCGISVRGLTTVAFMLSAGLGALGGCFLSPISQTTYDMGTELAIKGFTVAILGGLGNSLAAVGAGLLLGLLETFSIHWIPNTYKDVLAVLILLGILFFRPSGLFGNRELSRLKEF